MASSLLDSSAEKRLQRDAGIIIEIVRGRLTILELKITSYRGKKKNGEPEEKVTEPIVRGRKLSRGCFVKRKTWYDRKLT